MRKFVHWSLALVGAVLVVGALTPSVWGIEPKCECPATKPATAVGVPLFSKLPYLNRLFKNVGVAGEAETCECDEQAFERIGIDFDVCPDIIPGHPIRLECFEIRVHPTAEGAACGMTCKAGTCPPPTAQCVAEKCPACTDCKCTAKGCCASCGTKCACPGECESACTLAGKCTCAGQDSHIAKACKVAGSGNTDVTMWERIVELATAKAAAEAALAAREESLEMLESFTELAAENAKLTATIEHHAAQRELLDEMVELATENARLKAHVELADAKNALLQETVRVAVENERLKLRLAQLEGHRGSAGAAHTAAKPSDEQPPR